MGELSGKVAVITGSSRGLGFAIAQAYAWAGASVVITSRTAAQVEAAVQSIRAAGGTAWGMPCNVSDRAQVEELAARAIAQFGRLDLWVNNAGISNAYGDTVSVPVEGFERVVQTNILGTYYGSVTAMRHFLEHGAGKLINLTGRGDRGPVPFQNGYASSKTWVRSFTLALAKEYKGSGVGVYLFNPGLVFTELLSQVEVAPGYEQKVQPLQVVAAILGNPPEVPARKALWLASSATDGRTGLSISLVGPGRMLGGLLRYGWNRMMRRSATEFHLNVKVVE